MADMKDNEKLEQYLALCQRVYERMKREGSWPWDSACDDECMIDYENNEKDL